MFLFKIRSVNFRHYKPPCPLEQAAPPPPGSIVSPKSTAFPVVAISTKSIILSAPGTYPLKESARVGDVATAVLDLILVVSPKSNAFPVVAIVIKSILFT